MAQAYWTPPGSGEGSSGENGATFTPNVNETTGILSWTNDKGLDNPPAVNVKGPQGDPGADGADGADGVDGFSPVITENAGNTPVDYRLDITTATGTITTPNLQAVSFVENAQVYSTEETVIGTWIDGKPLYSRTFVSNLSNTNDGVTAGIIGDMSDANVDVAPRIYGTCQNPADLGNWTPIPSLISELNNSALYVRLYYSSAKQIRETHTTSTYNGALVYVTVEYTKTTDTATIAIATAAELTDAYEEGVQAA